MSQNTQQYSLLYAEISDTEADINVLYPNADLSRVNDYMMTHICDKIKLFTEYGFNPKELMCISNLKIINRQFYLDNDLYYPEKKVSSSCPPNFNIKFYNFKAVISYNDPVTLKLIRCVYVIKYTYRDPLKFPA